MGAMRMVSMLLLAFRGGLAVDTCTDDTCTSPGEPAKQHASQLLQVKHSSSSTRISKEHVADTDNESGGLQETPNTVGVVPSYLLGVDAAVREKSDAVTLHTHGSSQDGKVLLQQIHKIDAPDGRCLNFLHIPKNAGSSVEEVRHTQQILEGEGTVGWGVHNYTMRCNQTCVAPCYGCELADEAGRIGHCSKWHVPPVYDSVIASSYTGCETFCITRHPVAKTISEHMYAGGTCDAASFAETVRKRSVDLLSDIFYADCHWVHQSTYTGRRQRSPEGQANRPHCQRVLRYEHLQDDFNALMAEYELPLSLATHHALPGGCDLAKHMETISPETIQWIEKFYKADYLEFGYPSLADELAR